MEIKIDYKDLRYLEKFIKNEVQKELVDKALKIGVGKTRRDVVKQTKRTIKDEKLAKYSKDAIDKRVFESQNDDYYERFNNNLFGIRFGRKNESLSLFKTKKVTTESNRGKRKSFITNLYDGREIGPQKNSFLLLPKKISLRRTESDKYPLNVSRAPKSSLSDIIRYNKHVLDKVVDNAKDRFEYNVSRALREQIRKIKINR